jgi:hypothetical protein
VLRVALAAAVLVPLASCGSSVKLYPVRGKVFYDGQPAEGATVVFHRKGGPADSPKPSGTVGADGSFALSTHPHGDGAPAGDYEVIITWYPPNSRGAENPKNKLPARYTDPAQSGLKATVRDGPTELEPFQLTK